ncbi:hypothetical protein SteCoe_13548 [Stentor coeruleus]|uniref:Uncharacterized protein n=1 Tax=Stentor coeruleus TaxID=5963 RepID=A0A1R2C816_9CILI|nr:hypothetical protein SteCoe_13548 [Stentor coeruleus]
MGCISSKKVVNYNINVFEQNNDIKKETNSVLDDNPQVQLFTIREESAGFEESAMPSRVISQKFLSNQGS